MVAKRLPAGWIAYTCDCGAKCEAARTDAPALLKLCVPCARKRFKAGREDQRKADAKAGGQ